MATIVNNPPPSNNNSGGGGGMGMIVGLVLLVVIGFLFFVYGIPALQNLQLGATQINVPDKIDVNVNQTK